MLKRRPECTKTRACRSEGQVLLVEKRWKETGWVGGIIITHYTREPRARCYLPSFTPMFHYRRHSMSVRSSFQKYRAGNSKNT